MTLHTKNNFSLAIVTGNLFAEDNDAVSDLLAGRIAIPLPTYFTVGTNPLPQRIIEKIEKDEDVSFNADAQLGSSADSHRSARTSTSSESAAPRRLPKELKSLLWDVRSTNP
jgi:hypothetical protein